MKRLKEEREDPRPLMDSSPSDNPGLLKTGVFSLLLHAAFVAFLFFNLNSAITGNGPSVYRVTLRPSSPPGGGNRGAGQPGLPGGSPAASPTEKSKPEERPKASPPAEKAVPRQEKTRKSQQETISPPSRKERPSERVVKEEVVGLKKPLKGEKATKERGSDRSLEEALREIHKKVALDELQKKVARRGAAEKGGAEGGSSFGPGQGPGGTGSSRSASLPGSGTGTGSGSGSGTGTGSGTGFGTGTGSGSGGWGSSLLESKLNEYYSLIWAKIKEGWTLPEDLPKGKADLEAVIVVVIEREGKVQKTWFEKRSGSALYDQMALRAIKKADPFPAVPKEFGDAPFEIGIRFHPE
jgi:TonB family protein